ncbi:MAG: dihydrofolate reductase family protein [Acidobacteria bacterium]|nr:dihydrofolate reductase family protein [Acidobacteriota bacterium]
MFSLPKDLEPFEVLFDHSEPNPALPRELLEFAGNVGFPAPPAQRPWVYANFVQSLDGVVSFGGRHPEGKWVARSRHDRWMMDLLRAHADAVLCGARSLREEARFGAIPGGPVFRIVHPELLHLRQESLGRAKLKNIVVTGSGHLQPSEYRLFRSEHVEAWIATTAEGLERLGRPENVRILVCGKRNVLDLEELLRVLRAEHGIEYLLCEGGPTLYGHLLRGGWVDEKFLTLAPQEIGLGLSDDENTASLEETRHTSNETTLPRRLSGLAGPGFTIETAPWYRWLSCRKAGDHEFNRYRARRWDQPDPTAEV